MVDWLHVPHNTALVLRSVAMLGAACGVIGTFLLLRKRSLAADALSHAALPGVVIGFLLAYWLGQDARSLAILLPSAALAGAIGVGCIHALTALPRVKEDAAIGAVLSVFFAAGIVLLGIANAAAPDAQKAGLHAFIFGQAATMTIADSRVIAVIAIAVVIVAIATFKELRLLCFDAEYASSIGFSRLALDVLLMSLVTVLVVIGLHAVGALLMVALLIIPAAAARLWTDRLSATAIMAAAVGAIGAFSGAAASAVGGNVPTGPAIVIACGILFAGSMLVATKRGILIEAARRWLLARQIARQHLLRAMWERGEMVAAPVMIPDLHERREWSDRALNRLLRRAIRQGDLAESPAHAGYVLTDSGSRAAQRIVRTHRLWEHYLTTHADVAPAHVDHAVEDIEHVLGGEIVAELERTMRLRDAVPQSPHDLAGDEGTPS